MPPVARPQSATSEQHAAGSGTPTCASCSAPFAWPQARVDRGTTAVLAPRAPQLHCPHCDAAVAQWHLDLVSDHASWVWTHAQAAANAGVELPADPPHRWTVVPGQRGTTRSREDGGVTVP